MRTATTSRRWPWAGGSRTCRCPRSTKRRRSEPSPSRPSPRTAPASGSRSATEGVTYPLDTMRAHLQPDIRSHAMTSSLPLFPTTVVGSMPRPQYVKDLLQLGSRTGQHDAAWQRRMDDAVRFVIGMQEQAGIDIISDGEWRRETYVDVIAELMHGFHWLKRDLFAYHQVVVEKMRPNRPGVVAEEARFLRENTTRHVQ